MFLFVCIDCYISLWYYAIFRSQLTMTITSSVSGDTQTLVIPIFKQDPLGEVTSADLEIEPLSPKIPYPDAILTFTGTH